MKRKNFNINIPTSWDEVSLELFLKLKDLYKNEHKPTTIEIVSILSGKDEKYIKEMPALVFEKVFDNLEYISKPITNESNNVIEIDNERYMINHLEQLRTQEFIDTQMVQDNVVAVLAILCRKEGEVYDDDFIATKLNDRMEMFKNQPITKIQPLINFFLTLWVLSPQNMKSYSEKLLDHTNQLVKNIEDSLKNGTGKKHFLNSPMRKLKKLKKSLKYI